MTTTHLSLKQIESYALASIRGRIDEDCAETVGIEEHLLWCHSCLDAVEAEERSLRFLSSALHAARSITSPPETKVMRARQ